MEYQRLELSKQNLYNKEIDDFDMAVRSICEDKNGYLNYHRLSFELKKNKSIIHQTICNCIQTEMKNYDNILFAHAKVDQFIKEIERTTGLDINLKIMKNADKRTMVYTLDDPKVLKKVV